MLSKPATMLLGLIQERPLNAYEIIKQLRYMNVRWWFNIADSTVYATLKSLEKNGLIAGTVKKAGNMPEKTVYTITEKGNREFRDTLRSSILSFDYDTNIFSIAAFFMDAFDGAEKRALLEKRLEVLRGYLAGIEGQLTPGWKGQVRPVHSANVERMRCIVNAEISGAEKLLDACKEGEE